MTTTDRHELVHFYAEKENLDREERRIVRESYLAAARLFDIAADEIRRGNREQYLTRVSMVAPLLCELAGNNRTLAEKKSGYDLLKNAYPELFE